MRPDKCEFAHHINYGKGRIGHSFYLHRLLHDHRSRRLAVHKRTLVLRAAVRGEILRQDVLRKSHDCCIYKNFLGIHLCLDSFEASDRFQVAGSPMAITSDSRNMTDEVQSYCSLRHAHNGCHTLYKEILI